MKMIEIKWKLNRLEYLHEGFRSRWESVAFCPLMRRFEAGRTMFWVEAIPVPCDYGTDDEGKQDDMIKLLSDTCDALGAFNPSDYIRFCKNLDFTGFRKKLKDIVARFDVILEKMVDEHEEARKHTLTGQVKDLLDVLVDIKHDESMDIKLTRENIKALIQIVILFSFQNLFVAATDTTSEIYRVVGRNRLVQESDIPNLPYLQAIVKENFRLHPSTTLIQRKSPRDCTVAGYHIPANANVLINIWTLHRDPNHWEKPHEFRPERFMDNMLNVRGQHFHFLPFGTGRRMCPGISLALPTYIHTTLGG
ncbi:cytochrome P450 93A3-like protein [Tanacetum coccineum]